MPVSQEIIDAFLQVGVPTVVDILDYQYRFRGYMSHEIKPIFKTRIAGRAVTLKEIACEGEQPNGLTHLFEAVDACGAGDIFVADNEGNKTISLMGDLVAAALHARGAAGAVLNGAVRDIEPMIQMGFPVFASGVSPVNCTGKTVTVGCNIPLVCGGAQVNPGDVILADWDGVVVIPAEWAAEVLAKAQAVEAAERGLVERIRAEAPTRKLADIYSDAEGH
jgi:4-hydroxy-4-methyl-2-oxoglutarate aldolase